MNKIKAIHFTYLRNLCNRSDTEEVKKSLDPNNDYTYTNKTPEYFKPINFKDINLFIGQNGSGKSTIIDAIRSLSKSELLLSLPRDIPNDRQNPHLEIEFNDKSKITISFTNTPHKNGGSSPNKRAVIKETIGSISTSINGGKKGPIKLGSFDPSRIKYWDGNESLKNPPANLGKSLDLMNSNADLFSGVGGEIPGFPDQEQPCFGLNNNKIQVFCSDDPLYQNQIEYKFLPHGWRRLLSLTSLILGAKENEVLLIEEPEGYLHPNLQRFISRLITKHVKSKNLQVFISSHSPSIINSFSITSNTNVFHTKSHYIDIVPELTKDILTDIGAKASDLLQANGIIWVEGPSDRIYLKSWLEHYADQNKLPPIDFENECEFLYYGGALLSHYGEDNKDLISVLNVNRNGVLVMDRDLDGDLLKNPNKTKAKISSYYDNINSFYTWITCDYTMESYLEKSFRDKYFKVENKRLKQISHKSKVDIAREFIQCRIRVQSSFNASAGLQDHIKEMYNLIKKWNNKGG